jgi:hypothetical protein
MPREPPMYPTLTIGTGSMQRPVASLVSIMLTSSRGSLIIWHGSISMIQFTFLWTIESCPATAALNIGPTSRPGSKADVKL